ncbi:hypothetical protein GCM10022393_39470 [Aquimarina addita]|uniref:Uncharacterized protein n=1 Tax=Aquimarina addita TaxID=870485 RepID=A0ABP6UW71_9FLAO
MVEHIEKIKQELEKIVKDQLLPDLLAPVEKQERFLEEVLKIQHTIAILETSKQKNEILDTFIAYKQQLSGIVILYFDTLQKENTNLHFVKYLQSLETYINTQADVLTVVQHKDRFYAIPSDSRNVKISKFFKRTLFKCSKIPLRISNIFRKTKKPIHFWSQKVPVKGITSYFYKNTVILRLQSIIDVTFKNIAATTEDSWKLDTLIDDKIINFLESETPLELTENLFQIDKMLDVLANTKRDIKNILDAVLDTVFIDYQNALSKAGTFELANDQFVISKVDEKRVAIEKNIQKKYDSWNYTFSVLRDDWDIDLEIYNLVFKTYRHYDKLNAEVSQRANTIIKQLDVIRKYQNDVLKHIDEAKDNEHLKSNISEEIEKLSSVFETKVLSKVNQEIAGMELTSVITNFESSLQGLLAKVSTKRAISKEIDFQKPGSSSAINYISPYELINYESWPSFLEKINAAKVAMSLKFDDTIQTVNELGQIAEFNLESSLALLEEEISDANPKTVALEGIQRNLDKLDTLTLTVQSFQDDLQELLTESLDKFTKRMISFTENENILEIKLMIAKAISVEKSKAIKQKIKSSIIYAVPIAITFSKQIYTKSTEFVLAKMAKLGLLKNSGAITSELSDFLMEAERSVDKLPFVYQRLFRSETLHNEAFFIGNEKAVETIHTAYSTWKKDRFITVVIIGEKGAGKTSLFHYFKQKNEELPEVLMLSVDETIYTAEQLFEFLSISFSKELKSLEEWVSFLNTGRQRFVFLENLQSLYFRKIKGFEALHTLSELISLTYKNVFWVCTCAKYAYQYLDKSISLSDQFTHRIDVDDMDSKTLTDALVKRHKVSGYNLYFEEPPKEFLNKKYQKATEAEQQKILQAEFYVDLYKISKSNFKIAFMYWLRSATSVSGSTIHMRSLKNIDLSFIENLAASRLFILNGILQHEQLKIDHISSISGLDLAQTKRIVNSLYEIGLLTVDREYYTINTLLYRQIVTLLKSKNFLH